MVKCIFCGREESPHMGMHLLRNTGTVDYFCSSKCRKNSTKLKRDKRKVRWTEAFHITRGKARDREKAALEKSSKKAEEKPKESSKKSKKK